MPNKTVKIAIKKNSTVLTESIVTMLCVRSDEQYSGSGIAVTLLNLNDVIQIVVTTDGTGNIVTLTNLIASIMAYIR